MTFEQALAYMGSLRRHGMKLGNERMEALLDRLGSPHARLRCVHVTGTKGKGSTTALVASILQEHGWRVGAYLSPYVYDVRERIQVDGRLISRRDFARLVGHIAPRIDEVKAAGFGQITEFELKTAMGFLHFAREEVDFAVIEVGIGGRLDATNVLTPCACVITNVGLDHTDILGDTHALIAAEKAGILKRGCPATTAADMPEALEVIRRRAAELAVPLRIARAEGDALADVTWETDGERVTVRTRHARYGPTEMALRGAHQHANAACAVAAVEDALAAAHRPLDTGSVVRGLRAASLPGRFEVVRERPWLVMDGAHNALSAAALAREVRRVPYRRLLLVVGMLSGHSPAEFLAELAPIADRVYATRPDWRRAIPEVEVADAARAVGASTVEITPPLLAARVALSDAAPDDLVLVTGSFYLLGDAPPRVILRR